MGKAKLISVECNMKAWQLKRLEICNKPCPLNDGGYCIHTSCKKNVSVKTKVLHPANRCPNKFWHKHEE